MSFLTIHESDPDSTLIRDVLLCWESGEDGDDDVESVQVISKIEDHFDPIINIIPASPRRASYESIQSDQERLQFLMMKYPNFVPTSLPLVPPKRTRPVCLFVNYLGTRIPFRTTEESSPQNLNTKSKVTMEPSANPTAAPTRLTKRPRTSSTSCSDSIQTEGPIRQKIKYVSHLPTLGPQICRKVSLTKR